MWALVPLLTIPPVLRAVEGRPQLSGPAEHVDRDGFRVWFTREGRDAPSLSDDDADGLPDLVDAAVEALAEVAPAYEADGWRPLVGDGDAGGTDAIDVYIRDIGANGYAYAWPGPDGMSCFLELEPGLPVSGGVLASVAVHELHHCVQFRYTTSARSWVYESAATAEQYARVRDPLLDAALGVLWGERLHHPDLPLDAVDGRQEYAAFVWTKFWWERGGADYARLPAMWEALADEPDWQTAFDLEARRLWDEDLGEAFVEHALWNGFACAADDGEHYRADPLPCVTEVEVPTVSLEDEVAVELPDAWTTAYLDADPALRVTCEGEGVRSRTREGRTAVVATTGPTEAVCTATAPRARARPLPVSCAHIGGSGAWMPLLGLLIARRRSR